VVLQKAAKGYTRNRHREQSIGVEEELGLKQIPAKQ
jgi:hypothetical protein